MSAKGGIGAVMGEGLSALETPPRGISSRDLGQGPRGLPGGNGL